MKKFTLIIFKFLNKIFQLFFFKYRFEMNKINLINQFDNRIKIIDGKIICNFPNIKYEAYWQFIGKNLK